jgi:hypothetical protein
MNASGRNELYTGSKICMHISHTFYMELATAVAAAADEDSGSIYISHTTRTQPELYYNYNA